MTKRVLDVQQGRMQMAGESERMETFHQFGNSNYFRREKIQDEVIKVDDFWEIVCFTHRENLNSCWIK